MWPGGNCRQEQTRGQPPAADEGWVGLGWDVLCLALMIAIYIVSCVLFPPLSLLDKESWPQGHLRPPVNICFRQTPQRGTGGGGVAARDEDSWRVISAKRRSLGFLLPSGVCVCVLCVKARACPEPISAYAAKEEREEKKPV